MEGVVLFLYYSANGPGPYSYDHEPSNWLRNDSSVRHLEANKVLHTYCFHPTLDSGQMNWDYYSIALHNLPPF